MGWEKSNTSIFSLSMDCLNGYWYSNTYYIELLFLTLEYIYIYIYIYI